MKIEKDYKRLLAEDIVEFLQGILEPEFDNIVKRTRPLILGIQYLAHGNPYAASFNARLQMRGRTDYDYREIRLVNNHVEGYLPKEIKDREIIVVGMVLSEGIKKYLRELRTRGANRVYYAFRIPPPGGILQLEEMEKLFDD